VKNVGFVYWESIIVSVPTPLCTVRNQDEIDILGFKKTLDTSRLTHKTLQNTICFKYCLHFGKETLVRLMPQSPKHIYSAFTLVPMPEHYY
jgi:hypothetical protein